MIIGPRSAIILLDGIDGSLSDAVRGVVRISAGRPQGVGTGWLITPQLVIVPSYVVRDANRGSADVAALTVETFAGTRVAWRSDVEPVHVDAAEGSDLPNAITVVRLAQPDGPRPLRLGLDAPQVGRQVFVLQYPLGAPRLGMSTGHIVADEPPEPSYLSYTADTEPGAGGGPVLDEGWRVIGVHVRSVGPRRVNQAISRARLLDRLRASPVWAEIAAFQEIAEVRSVQVGFEALVDDTPAPILVRAATRASVERASLTDAEAEQLRPHVIDDAGARWSLRASDREDIIRRVGSLAALRASRDASQPDGAIDRAIVRILAGPPYDLTGEDDEVLGGWMQAARWFASVVPGLPSAALANVVLERRRLRGRLEGVGGAHFRGRAAELAELASWWDASPPVPFSLTGIGGVGKSALVAHYALSLPPSTVILWLDFDRPDLAPDQALSLLAALSEQARLQVEGLALTATTVWEDVANDLGAKLAAALGDRRTLLVLDSFEVAQYADRYQQLWPVVEKLMTALPGLRLKSPAARRSPTSPCSARPRGSGTSVDSSRRSPARCWRTPG